MMRVCGEQEGIMMFDIFNRKFVCFYREAAFFVRSSLQCS